MTAVLAQVPAHGTLTVNADGTWTYVAEQTFVGTDGFSYRISDGEAASELITLSFAVLPANTAPTAIGGAMQVQEDGSLIIDLAAFGTDAEGDVLTGVG